MCVWCSTVQCTVCSRRDWLAAAWFLPLVVLPLLLSSQQATTWHSRTGHVLRMRCSFCDGGKRETTSVSAPLRMRRCARHVVFLSFTFPYQQCNASTAAAQHQYRHALAHLQVHTTGHQPSAPTEIVWKQGYGERLERLKSLLLFKFE